MNWIAAANSIEELRAGVETHLRCSDISALAYITWPDCEASSHAQSQMKMQFGFSAASRRHIKGYKKCLMLREEASPFWVSLTQHFSRASVGVAKTCLIIPLFSKGIISGYMALRFHGLNGYILPQDQADMASLSQTLHDAHSALAQADRIKLALLTQEELEIIRWAALGKSDTLIANILAVSPQYIDRHMSSIFQKLEVSDRIKAGLRAIALGLI